MSNQLAKFGAQSSKPVRYGILYTGRMTSGIFTQRSPLRDACSSRVEEEFYGARGDALIDGLNSEVSAKLSFVRRPGATIYNSNTYPAINRFYEWRLFNSMTEQIKVMADTANSIFDVTGPGTGNASPTPLFVKSAGAGKTSFLGAGNNLYFSDGIDSQKVVGSLVSWSPSTSFSAGQYIVDSNGNLQIAVGSQTSTITNIQITGAAAPRVGTVFLSSATPLEVPLGTYLTFSGTTTIPALNGTTQIVSGVANSYQDNFSTSLPLQAYTTETGSVTTGTGITGASQPAWANIIGAVTVDGGAQWENRGPQVETWGIDTPVGIPSVTQADVPNNYSDWSANTWYAPPSGFIILAGSTFFQLTGAGVTGGSTPSWNTTLGATTTDGTAVWTSLGTANWIASHAYTVGAVIQVTYSYWVISQQLVYGLDPATGEEQYYYTTVSNEVFATNQFKCITAGTTGANQPTWNAGTGTVTQDNGVRWSNVGASAPSWPGATQTLSLLTQILDSNNNLQSVQQLGESGATAPAWATGQGSYTRDHTTNWLNSGPFGTANTGAWIYAYSYKNSVTGHVSTADPPSSPITAQQGNLVVLQGSGSSDPQVDIVVIWRTVQGGSTLFYLDEIPNPGGGQTWTYYDSTPDTGLDELIEAPIDDANDPPPQGLTALVYYLQRIWGAVNNSVYYSAGPDVTIGSGNEAWPPSNVFVFPSTVVRLFPTSSGLLVFTVSDIYIIQGLGTQNSTFYSAPFLSNIGLVSYDAFSVNGSIIYMYTSDNQVVSLDPSSGVSEVGFPIGDQFGPNNGTGTFAPASTQVTWHIAGSEDKGLYVSDSNGTWWRWSSTTAPEPGSCWSPKAQIIGGFSAVQSVEVLPGTHNLLIGPQTSGPILKRDYAVYSDNGSAYNAFAVLGSLVLAQPGQIAGPEFITADSVFIGTPLTLAVQLDEIAPVSAGYFETLSAYVPDPTELSPSLSVYAQRFYLSQTQEPAMCRHLQIQINWGADTVKNELLSLSLFGFFEQEL